MHRLEHMQTPYCLGSRNSSRDLSSLRGELAFIYDTLLGKQKILLEEIYHVWEQDKWFKPQFDVEVERRKEMPGDSKVNSTIHRISEPKRI